MTEGSDRRSKDIYWSRFVPSQTPVTTISPSHQVQTSPRVAFSHPVNGPPTSPTNMMQTMPVVRKISVERRP